MIHQRASAAARQWASSNAIGRAASACRLCPKVTSLAADVEQRASPSDTRASRSAASLDSRGQRGSAPESSRAWMCPDDQQTSDEECWVPWMHCCVAHFQMER